jgi:hypothetical protein
MVELNPDSAPEKDPKYSLYKFRAAEYLARYESMRSVEWRVLFQTYGGYAAIAIVSVHIHGKFQHGWLGSFLIMAMTVAFFIATQYLYARIQERLINFNETYEAYANAMHWVPSFVEELGPSTAALGHQYYWTYTTQLLLSIFIVTGFLVYQAASLFQADLKCAGIVCGFLFFAVTLFAALILRRICVKRPKRIWYASYGSNLSFQERFMCYIRGGQPVGAKRINTGCRDKTPPLASKPILLKFQVYFAGESKSWGGAPAFIRQGNNKAITLGRMYLITDEQFNDVVLQENDKDLDGRRFVPPFEKLDQGQDFVLPNAGMYNQLVYVGKQGGYPIYTFTGGDDLPIGAPSESYVKVIVSGMKKTYPHMKESQICEYLSRAEGTGGIESEVLAKWVRESE